MMAATVSAAQRFTPHNPCPICGGHDRLPRGDGRRCWGFLGSDGRYAHCSRTEHADGLPLEPDSGTYAHRLAGSCRCGATHGEAEPEPATIRRNGAGLSPRVYLDFREAGAVRAYDYQDEAGDTLYQVWRYEAADGGKTFKQARPAPAGWALGIEGVRRVPYRLPELLAADPSAWVLVVEGEKDADRLAGRGFVATTNAMGAGKWLPEYSAFLKDRRVCLLLDNDPDGEKHGEKTGGSLAEPAAEVRVLRLSGLPPKGDVSDWLDAGGTVDELARLIEGAPAWEPMTETKAKPGGAPCVRFVTAREFAEQTPAQTPWVVEPFVPVGGIAKIDGAPKAAGKTTLITHMIAAVLNGTDFLGKPTRQGPAVLLTEQGSTSFRESLKRADLLQRDDLHLAVYRDFAALDWPDVVAQALGRARDVGAVLLVVDTLPACAGVRGDDENSAGRALEVMEPVQVGADTFGVGVIIAFHDKKGGGEVGESGRGSGAYAGAVDVVLRVTKPGGNFSPTIRKIEALSRFETTPPELYIELTDAGYVSLGSEADVVSGAIARTLATVLPRGEEAAIRVEGKKQDGEVIERGIQDELAAAGVKAARSTVDAELERWRTAGYVSRTGEGKSGSPYRYWLTAEPPADFFRSKTTDPSEERNSPDPLTNPPRGGQRGHAREKQSSDAPPPSEERNSGDTRAGKADPLHSSDGSTPYNGRNNQDGKAEKTCTECGAPFPADWPGYYCERHGGRPAHAADPFAGGEDVIL